MDVVVSDNVFRRATEESIDTGPGSPHRGDAAAKPQKPSGPSYVKWSKSRLLNTLRVGNCCNGLCLITAAIVCFIPAVPDSM